MKLSRGGGLQIATNTLSSLRAKALKFGFVPLENALGDELMADLRAEALAQRANARPAEGTEANPYRSYIADVGDCARSFLTNQSVGELLQTAFDQPLELSAHANCYTYYEPGSFLSRHRDRPVECVATLIVYLDAVSPDPQSPETGLSLRVFGHDETGGSKPRRLHSDYCRYCGDWARIKLLARASRTSARGACYCSHGLLPPPR